MRIRIVAGLAGAGLILMGTGCVGVVGNTTSIRPGTMEALARKPVVMNGELYIVDVRTGESMLAPNPMTQSTAFRPIPAGIDDDD